MSYKREDTGRGGVVFEGEGVCQTMEGGYIVTGSPPCNNVMLITLA